MHFSTNARVYSIFFLNDIFVVLSVIYMINIKLYFIITENIFGKNSICQKHCSGFYIDLYMSFLYFFYIFRLFNDFAYSTSLDFIVNIIYRKHFNF